jgi:hypothetical protein
MLDDARKKYWIEKDAWTSTEIIYLLSGIDILEIVQPGDLILRMPDNSIFESLDGGAYKAPENYPNLKKGLLENGEDFGRAIDAKKMIPLKSELRYCFLPNDVIQWAQSHKEKYPNFPFINYEVQNVSEDKTKNLTKLEKIYLEVKNMYYGAGKFDPKDWETIPTSEEVINSVQEIGKKHHIKVSTRTAIAFAQMMRPEGVPSGRRPLK